MNNLEGSEYAEATRNTNVSTKITDTTRTQARLIVTITGETLQDLFARLVNEEFQKNALVLANMLASNTLPVDRGQK
jgi:hypothetical protein